MSTACTEQDSRLPAKHPEIDARFNYMRGGIFKEVLRFEREGKEVFSELKTPLQIATMDKGKI
jgi:hypothetical protein